MTQNIDLRTTPLPPGFQATRRKPAVAIDKPFVSDRRPTFVKKTPADYQQNADPWGGEYDPHADLD